MNEEIILTANSLPEIKKKKDEHYKKILKKVRKNDQYIDGYNYEYVQDTNTKKWHAIVNWQEWFNCHGTCD